MQKLVSIFSLVIFFTALAFGQAAVTFPFSCTDGTLTFPIAIGLDPAATNCIDPGLGESDLPPFPPPGVFDIRFDLSPYGCPNLSTWLDFRFATFPFSGPIQHMLWWQVTTPGVSSINITYNLPPDQSMTIVDNITGTLLNLGPFFGSGVAVIPATYTAFGTKAILTLTYVNIPIPVELTSFTGTVMQDGVLLNWTTATELNNRGFEIERSTSIQSWEKIGYVPGFGTTTEPKSYSFLDQNVTNGSYTYRLKQLDFDGTVSYLDEIEVVVDLTPDNFELSQNYPNPFNPSTTIQFQVPNASDVTIKVYDMLGQEVRSLFAGQVQAGKYTVEWDGMNNAGLKMSSGSYIYRMTAGDFVEVKEMVLLK
jgi:hypothetical protein